ncbi:MAG: putative methyltransferase [Chthonomonadaceae bacterium]|nr:putative methyltransferase [Chthonomonadaceae bacterium]
MAETISLTDRNDVRKLLREKYGAAALTVLKGQGAACCGGNTGGGNGSCCSDTITGGLYDDVEAASIPEAALLASLGCGNPTALAALRPGEIVLDLGSGGGIDVLLSAKRVGPTGFAYGLDMTDAMLALAEKNKAEAGAENVQFLKGHIEEIPLPDNSVDVIISNCVINLSADKDAVLREAFRVLKPGGRFAVSDVVVDGVLPPAVRADMEAYVGCVAGALERTDYIARLSATGFVEASIEPTRRYTFAGLEATTCCSPEVATLPAAEKAALDGRVMGAFIRATKPAACCGSDCCPPKEAADSSSAKPIPMATIALTAREDPPQNAGPLKLSAFKALLEGHREKQFQLVLPNARAVPVCFHITEVAHIQKRFIDCGGRLHTTHTCQLQAWVWTDTEHRLLAGKIADVLNIAKKVLPEGQDLDIEIEYEDTTISQYPVASHTVTDDAVTLHLAYKHTDCLAKDLCLPAHLQPIDGTAGCCGPSCNC